MKTLRKDVLDQLLHFSIGAILTLLFSLTVHIAISAVVVLLGAWIREGLQRIKNGDSFFKCGSGCMLDLLFWSVGIGTGVLIKVFVL